MGRPEFPHLLTIPTRWKDNDVYGHVNNVEYYSFFDTVINRWLITQGGLDITDGDVIGVCAESHCTYHDGFSFPEDVEAGLRVGKLGTSSVRYEIELFATGAEEPSAQGWFVHVFVDAKTRRPVPIPDGLRSCLEMLRVDLHGRALGDDDVVTEGGDAEVVVELVELGVVEASFAGEQRAGRVGGGADHAIETVGSAKVLADAYAATRRGGTTTTVGLPDPSQMLTIPAVSLVAEERTLRGSYLGSSVPATDLPKFIDLHRQGRLPVERLLTHRLSLDEVNEGFDRLASGEAVRQAILFD